MLFPERVTLTIYSLY